MKPILLTIEGLQSFRELQAIRFDELSDAGVFGIFGPTGSGKSTILDAITLALYGTVWRAKSGTQGIMNHAEKSLSVSFQFQIGMGTERKVFQVERAYKRTNEISVNHKASRLRELDANGDTLNLIEGKNEVTQKVQEILGLEPSDFFRAVVLPQGQFADFLKLSGAERRAMLQKLFALERYGSQLSERLKGRLQTVTSELEGIKREQAGMGDCSKEALERAMARLTEAQQQETEAANALTRILTDYETKKKLVELQNQIKDTQHRIDQHAAKTAEINLLSEEVARAEQAAKVFPVVVTCRQLETDYQLLDGERALLEMAIEGLRVESDQAEKSYEAVQKEKAEKYPQLIEKKAKVGQALQLETETTQLQEKVNDLTQQVEMGRHHHEIAKNQIVDLTNQQIARKKELDSEKRRLDQNTVPTEYRNKLSNAVQKREMYQTALEDMQKVEQELNNRQTALDAAKKDQATATLLMQTLQEKVNQQQQLTEELKQNPPADESLLNQQAERLAECKGDVDRIHRLEEDEGDHQRLFQTVTIDKEQLTTRLVDVQGKLQTEKENVAQLRQLQQDFLRQNKQAMALQLAEDLCDGEACPVCGSHEHPNPALSTDSDGDLHQELQEIQIQLDQANADVSNLQEEEVRLRTEISSKEVEVRGIQQAMNKGTEEKRSIMERIRSVLPLSESMTVEGDYPTAEQLSNLFEQEKQLVAEKRRELEAWEIHCKEAEIELQKLKEDLAKHNSIMTGLEQKMVSAQTELTNADGVLEQKKDMAERASKAFQDTLTDLGSEDLDQLQTDLRSKDEEYENAKSKVGQLEKKLEKIREDLSSAERTESDLKAQVAGLDSSLKEANTRLKVVEGELLKVTGGIPVEELLSQLEKQIQQLEQNELAAKDSMESKKGLLQKKSDQLTQVLGRLQQLSESLDKARQDMAAKLQEFHFVTTEQVEDCLLTAEEMDDFNQRIQAHKDQEKILQSEIRKLENQLNGQQVPKEEWQEIQEKRTAAEEAKKSATDIRAAAQFYHQELQTKNILWEQLDQRRLEFSKQEGYLNHLKNLLAGDKFVEFIAQEQMEVVARQASERLKRLTRNRYALKVAADGGFIMQDDANGGVNRPVTTLSGGETFLTSLALALSLSTQIQLRGKYPLEFFFLDEGFGTLDADLLDVVMATLEQLQVENMTIGVISHVPELRQRLHRRLIVEPAEAAGRGTLVRVEKM